MAAAFGEESFPGLGERVRALRRSAGLTQSELACGRFSKEYLSQIERGTTVPSSETVEWLAQRLGTDAAFLEFGMSDADGDRVQTALVAAEGLLEVHRHNSQPAAGFSTVRAGLSGTHMQDLVLRALRGEAWARIREGELDEARSLLEQALPAVVAADPGLSDVDRAEVEFLVGVFRYTSSDIDGAIAQLGSALELAEMSGLPCDGLRSDIFHWRSRCWRRLRDWAAAREDIDRALELADARSDPRQVADAYFQASLVAQREGRWVLARRDAEQSKELFEQLGDRATVGRSAQQPRGHQPSAWERAARDRAADRGIRDLRRPRANARGGLCVQLSRRRSPQYRRCGGSRNQRAEGAQVARRPHRPPAGDRCLPARAWPAVRSRRAAYDGGQELTAAASIFADAKSVSHQADGWIARGDLAQETGDVHEAARLFRQATQASCPPPTRRPADPLVGRA